MASQSSSRNAVESKTNKPILVSSTSSNTQDGFTAGFSTKTLHNETGSFVAKIEIVNQTNEKPRMDEHNEQDGKSNEKPSLLDGDIGCGLLLISICVGFLLGWTYGWLMFGCFLVLFGLLDYFGKRK